VLNPWPSNVNPPARVCVTPSFLGAPYSVATGGSITLSGAVNANATSPVTLAWTAGTTVGGTDLNGALTAATTSTPTFNSLGLAAGVYNVRFAASNICGAVSVDSTITVQAAPTPTINPITAQTVNAGSPVTVTATTTSLPAPTVTWAQTGGPVLAPTFTQTPAAATPTASSTIGFTPTVAGVYTFSVTATNANGTSPATTATVTVNATATQNLTFTNTEYRIGKQRAVFAVTTTDLTVTAIKLQPYMTETGTMFDPATLGAASFTNGGGGLWSLTVVGSPKPACNVGGAYATPCSKTPFIATSTGGVTLGTSAPTVLQKIRQ
jgi:hypothetical protein